MSDPLGGLGHPREPPPQQEPSTPPRARRPPPPVASTLALLALLVLGFVVEVWLDPSRRGDDPQVLLRLGSLFAPALRDGDWWRLGSYAFLHIGAVHLLVNGYALWVLGREVESAFGSAAVIGLFAATALAGGATSSLAALAAGSTVQSAGASGGIFGLFGATAALWLRLRHHVAPEVLRRVLRNFAFNLLINVAITFAAPVDWRAHAGGFVAGLLLGLLAPTTLLPRQKWHLPIQAALLAAALVLAASEGAAVARAVSPRPRHLFNEKDGVEASIPWLLAPVGDGIAASPGGLGLRAAVGRARAPLDDTMKTVQLGERRFALSQGRTDERDNPCLEETTLVSDDDERLLAIVCCMAKSCAGVEGEKIAETIAATLRSTR